MFMAVINLVSRWRRANVKKLLSGPGVKCSWQGLSRMEAVEVEGGEDVSGVSLWFWILWPRKLSS